MLRKQFDISLALGLNEHYDHRVAVGIIKFARARADWRLFGSDWLLHSDKERRDFRPDVVHSNMIHSNVFTRLLRLVVRFPALVCSEHTKNAGSPVVKSRMASRWRGG